MPQPSPSLRSPIETRALLLARGLVGSRCVSRDGWRRGSDGFEQLTFRASEFEIRL